MTIFKDKTLLITGGTSSFGNAVLNRFSARTSARFASSAATRKSRTTCVLNDLGAVLSQYYGKYDMSFPQCGLEHHDQGRGPLSTWVKQS